MARLYVVRVSLNKRNNQVTWRLEGSSLINRHRVTLGTSAASSSLFLHALSATLSPLYAADLAVFSALVRPLVPSFSVCPAREDVHNREKIFCELLATPPLALVSLIKKDEARTSSGDDPLDELDPEAAKAIAVGHHNLVDHSILHVPQKPLEAFPLVVEAGRDVLVD